MVTEFTKGPYRYQRHNRPLSNTCYHEVFTDHNDEFDDLIAHASTEANAYLIAAAPDMYNALEILHNLGGLGQDKHKMIQDVLTKARGN